MVFVMTSVGDPGDEVVYEGGVVVKGSPVVSAGDETPGEEDGVAVERELLLVALDALGSLM